MATAVVLRGVDHLNSGEKCPLAGTAKRASHLVEAKLSRGVTVIPKTPPHFSHEVSAQDEAGRFLASRSELSGLLGREVTHLDIISLFLEIMKLSIHSRESEKTARQFERLEQIKHMEEVVSNFKASGKWLLFAGLGAGVLGMASGVTPIVGHMAGDKILGKLSTIFSSLQGMKQKKFFDGVSKMTYAMSEMYKQTGQIHGAFSEGGRHREQQLGDMRRTDHEEQTRKLQQLSEEYRGIEAFIRDALQRDYDTASRLYR